MEERIGWLIIIIAIILLFALGIRFFPAGVYSGLAVSGFVLCYVLDQLFSASLLPAAPWVMWAVVGLLTGGCFAFWTIAPIFGMRKQRPLVLLAPVAVILVLAVVRFLL